MTVPMSLTRAQAHAARARRHLLSGTADLVPPPAGVVASRLAGIQAQVESTAGLCLAAPPSQRHTDRGIAGRPWSGPLWAMCGMLRLVATSDVHRQPAAGSRQPAARNRRPDLDAGAGIRS